MSKTFLFFILVFLTACSQTTSLPKATITRGIPANKIQYVVKRGDSLWKISKRYQTTVDEIMKINQISRPNSLQIGQKILIPQNYRKSSSSFTWPLKGEIIDYYGENVNSSINRGLNISAGNDSRAVKAAAKGKVIFANQLKGWGHTVILAHGNEFYTIYANLDPALIKEGSTVEEGATIGQVASGKNGNHILHFEIRKRQIPQDPVRYLN